uniref:Transposase n=1 Tax=Steinernema glaseri TaxID=37863 RepID=A0A1I7YJZ5_9BILA
MKKLFDKCAVANKAVNVSLLFKDFTKIFNSAGLIDYAKYYSERKVFEKGRVVGFRNKGKDKLELQICCSGGWVWWTWSKARQSS